MIHKIGSFNKVPYVKSTFSFTEVYVGGAYAGYPNGTYTNLIVFKNKLYCFPYYAEPTVTSDGISFLQSSFNLTNFFLRTGYATSTTMVLCGQTTVNTNGIIYRSTDTVSWVSSQPTNFVYSVMANGTNWVAVGEGGDILYSSDDALTFTKVVSGWTGWTGLPVTFRDVAYGNGFWVAIGYDSASPYYTYVLKSTDGVNWSLQSGHNLSSTDSIHFSNGTFILSNKSKTTDCITFTSIGANSYFGYSPFFANGVLLCIVNRVNSNVVIEQLLDDSYPTYLLADPPTIYSIKGRRPFTVFQNKVFYGNTSYNGVFPRIYSAPII